MTFTGSNLWPVDHDRPGLTTGSVKPYYTLMIRGRVWWPRPVATGYLITRTGCCQQLHTRFTRLGKLSQYTLKIHGRVLWRQPVATGSGRPARSLELRARSCFAHRPDYSSVFTKGLGLTQYNCIGNIRMIFGYTALAYRANNNITVLSCLWTQLIPTRKTL